MKPSSKIKKIIRQTKSRLIKFNLKSNNGFTLIELMLVLGTIVVLSATTWIGYHYYSLHQGTQIVVQDSLQLSNNLSGSYGQTGSFANLSSNAIKNNKLAPFNLIKEGALKGPWGGLVDVASNDPNNKTFSITWNQIPSGACSPLVTQLFKAFPSIVINGQNIEINNGKIDISKIASSCNQTSNTIVLTSKPLSNFAGTGEVVLPVDHGAPKPLPPVAPPTQGVKSVAAVNAVQYNPATINAPIALNKPTAAAITVTPTTVTQVSTTTTSLPPTTVLPPQTCYPSSKSVPVNSTEYNTQTLSCSSGYSGSIAQQQSRTKTVTTTTTLSCATPWSSPTSNTTSSTTYTNWSPWSTTGNTCSIMCSAQLSNGGYPTHYNYQWVTVNVGCPAGYSGTNTYQAQQVQSSTAFCANPAGSSSPTYGPWSAWTNTGATQNAINTCKAAPSTASISNSKVCIGSGNDPSNSGGGGTCGANSVYMDVYSGASPTCQANFKLTVGSSSTNQQITCTPGNSNTLTVCSQTYNIAGTYVKVAIGLNFDSNNAGVGTTTSASCGGYETTMNGKCTHSPAYPVQGGSTSTQCVW